MSGYTDRYPATEFQADVMAISIKHPGSFTSQYVQHLDRGTDAQQLRAAWNRVAQRNAILRSCLVNADEALYQVVAPDIKWRVLNDTGLDLFLDQDRAMPIGIGDSLTRYAIVHDPITNKSSFVWTAHHAAYDRRSLSLLVNDVERAYYAQAMTDLPSRPDFSLFVELETKPYGEDWEPFWRKELIDAPSPSFPAGPLTVPDKFISRQISYQQLPPTGITMDTLIKATWSLVLSQYESSADIVFGTVVSGRAAHLAWDLDAVIGPTMSTVPLRVKLNSNATVDVLLSQIQSQTRAMASFEQTGLRNIRTVSDDAKFACSFRNLLIVQEQPHESNHRFNLNTVGNQYHNLISHPLTIEFTPGVNRTLDVNAAYQSSCISTEMMNILMQQFDYVLRQILEANGDTNVGDITCLTPEHEILIQTWNPPLEPAVSQCLPELLSQRSISVHPQRPAISSWDGDLSYGELDQLAGRLAVALVSRGIGPECFVPICFEKSMWAVVAMLGILKAGGAVVVIDPTYPLARRRAILNQISPKVALSSIQKAGAFQDLVEETLVVSEQAMYSLPQPTGSESPTQKLLAQNAAFVLFTSGTTGQPKGILFDHAALCTSLLANGSFMKFGPESRVCQFAAYTFDISISDIFTTLLFGGLVCIISDKDRHDNLAGAMRSLHVNKANLTPTVASLIEPADVPELKSLTVAGEMATRQVIETWADHVELMNVYGPAEASICAGLAGMVRTSEPTCVGQGIASSLWIADIEDHRKRAPIGVIGELLIEGPLLACGYLNDPAKTAKSFITNLPWALGNNRRFYKSGDLAKYSADGQVHIMGRIDTQIKVRGQRTEIGEVEELLQRCLPRGRHAIVELVQPKDGSNMLVAFIAYGEGGEQQDRIPYDLQSVLQETLPSYMVPSHFIPIPTIPLSASGKIDRKKLREMVSRLSLGELLSVSATITEGRPPAGIQELRMQDLWSSVLNASGRPISAEDSFFNLGGDSITAMRLVAVGLKAGLKISVAEIFTHPILSDMALVAVEVSSENILLESPPPFSLLGRDIHDENLLHQAAEKCGVAGNKIVDMYPCTPLQEGLMALSATDPGSYLGQFVFSLPDTLHPDQFAHAWNRLIDETPIMRSCIISTSSRRFLQVVMGEDVVRCHRVSAAFGKFFEGENQVSIGLGDPLMRYSLVQDPETGGTHFFWTAHHSSYDAHSLRQTLLAFEGIYMNLPLPKPTQYNTFIQHIIQSRSKNMTEFWQTQLENAPVPWFPALPESSYRAVSTESVGHLIKFSKPKNCHVTPATLLRASWALLLSRYENAEDVVFAAVVNGRNHPVAGIETMIAPTFATLPVRVRTQSNQSVKAYLAQVQQQAVDMMLYEQTGLQAIADISPEIRSSCTLRTLMLVQAAEGLDEALSDVSLGLEKVWERQNDFLTYPLGVECTLGHNDTVHINVTFDPVVVTETEASRLASQLGHILRHISANSSSDINLSQLEMIGTDDLTVIRDWNSHLPNVVNDVLHGRFSHNAKIHPNKSAICSPEGEMTYHELAHLSTLLGSYLRERGVGAGVGVPVCFEKSPFAIISMLGTLKAGGYFIPMDPSQPQARLRDICTLIDPSIILASPQTAVIFQASPLCTVITITDSWLKSLSPTCAATTDEPAPSSLAYTIFTSGTQGIPKGVSVEHLAICSSIRAHEQPLGFSGTTRMLQFASFAFDVAIAEVFTTLSVGGCICLPSDAQRQNDIVGAMQEFKVTSACFTPSMIQGLRLDQVPTLQTLIAGGEKITKSIIEGWSGKLKLINGYGPTEASVLALSHHIDSADSRPGVIGKTCGCTSWIVEPTNASRLVPIGAIGELLLEGPILARGYLDDLEKTRAAFVTQPSFIAGPEQLQERFYKTGDLVRYMPDGSLEFIGRKDSQVKIRGQRVEMGEIEARVRAAADARISSIAVEVVSHKDRADSQAVAVYLCYPTPMSDSIDFRPLTLDQRLRDELETLKRDLSRVLPSYMVPSIFIPLRKLPYSTAGKVDSKALHRILNRMSLEELTVYSLVSDTKQPVSNAMESHLQKLWAATLNLKIEAIGANDSFFQLGGDSITSTHLAAMALEENINLSVQDIFKHPTLSAMSSVATGSTGIRHQVIEPLSLIPLNLDKNQLVKEAAAQCAIDVDDVEDMFPCTALQDGFMTLSVKEAGYGAAQFVWLLPESLDVSRFQSAWDTVDTNTPILRSRITQTTSAPAMMQVVVRSSCKSLRWTSELGLNSYLAKDQADLMVIGRRLVRHALVQDEQDGDRRLYFVLTIHHSVYDGWMLDLVMRDVEKVYKGGQITPAPAQFNAFIKHLENLDSSASKDYWTRQLDGALPPVFPELPPMTYRPLPDQNMMQTVAAPAGSTRGSDITISTKIRAAWALIVSRYSDEDDVVFASTLNGRTAQVPFIDMIVGPTVTTVPVRIRIDPQKTVGEMLNAVQEQAVDMMAHEQFGHQNIRRISSDCNTACQFRSLLLIQSPHEAEETSEAGLGLQSVERGSAKFHTYPLTIECTIRRDEFDLLALYDSQVIDPRQMSRILHQFAFIFGQLDKFETTLRDLDWMSLHDLEELAKWNPDAPKPTERCVHDLVQERILDQPDEPALCSWEGELTFRQLDDFSARLACQLRLRGVRAGVLVPLLFEKSIWGAITMLAVLRAGGANVALDPAHPEERLRGILNDVEGHIIISDLACADKARSLLGNVLIVDRPMLQSLALPTPPSPGHQQASPSSPAFILFTSGSTGRPKGIIITHSAFSSSMRGHAEALRYRKGSRNLQFTAYTSDVSIGEIFTSLSVGACVCVPSDYERMNGIAAAMERMRVDWAFFTPSVALLLNPDDVPSLKVLLYGGETATPENIFMWADRLYLINSFGPAECSIWTHCNPGCSVSDIGSNIGYAIGCVTWIVDADDFHKLAPIGTVGELLIEGPNVAQGYLKNETKTAESFIENPAWMPKDGRRRRLYRLGDLARYLPDGKVQFIGRRDAQVKLRGQRIELGEIEHQLRELIPELKECAVEMVKLAGPRSTNMLAAFMSLDIAGDSLSSSTSPETTIAASPEHIKVFQEMTRGLDAELALRIPNHMIPTLYIPLLQMPLTASAKTDRKKLKQVASLISAQEMDRFTLTRRARVPVSTDVERQLQRLWAETLEVEPDSFSASDSFLAVGGDSLGAMRLVALAGGAGWSLSVRTIFQHPILMDMALVMQPLDNDSYSVTDQPPFSLLPQPAVPEIVAELAELCGIEDSRIQDAYPCTPLQDGMIAISTRDRNTYVGQFVFSIPPSTDVDRFKRAFNAFYQQNPMMRTRIAWPTSASGMVQVVVAEEPQWLTSNSLPEYLERDIKDIMALGTPLTRVALLDDPVEGPMFVLSAHHALFDHYSMLMFYDSMRLNYDALGSPSTPPPPPPPGFNRFIKHIQAQDQDAAREFWLKELEGAPRETFPTIPKNRNIDSRAHYAQRIQFPVPGYAPPGITIPTIITAALSLAQASYLDSTDIVFGTTISGRGVAVQGIESMPGPTITTMPVRIMFNKSDRIIDFLTSIQAKYAQITEFESFGLQNIRRLSPDTKAACDFQNMLFNQTQGDPPRESEFLGFRRLLGTPMAFGSIPLMIETDLSSDHIEIYMAAHPNMFSELQANRLMHLLKSLTIQLFQAHPEMDIRQLELLTPLAHDELVVWNGQSATEPPTTVAVHHAIESQMSSRPTAPAITSPDTCLTYAELDKFSGAIAQRLQQEGVDVGMTVALCSEKSVCAVVSRLAVLRAGAALVCLGPEQTKSQRDEILMMCSPRILLVSRQTEHLFEDLQHTTVMVVMDQLLHYLASEIRPFKPALMGAADLACFMSTSADHGEEAQLVAVEHGQLCTSLQTSASVLEINGKTKMLHFTPDTFYTSCIEIFATLMQGGCVCISSPKETDVAGAISQCGANAAILEASTIVTLQPQQVLSLETLVVVGKGSRADIVDTWRGGVCLFSAYGSPETTGFSLIHRVQSDEDSHAAILGQPLGCSAWVVDPDDHEKLVPIGAVGELLIQGSAVAGGYLSAVEDDCTAFISDLRFGHRSGSPSHGFKTGDLVRYNVNGDLEFIRPKNARSILHARTATPDDVKREIRSWLLGIATDCAVDEIVHGGQATLAAFILLDKQSYVTSDDTGLLEMTASIRSQFEQLGDHLFRTLPPSAVPSMYIPMKFLPCISKRLHLVQSVALETLQSWLLGNGDRKTMPVTEDEEKLQDLWAKVFGRPTEEIGAEDNFFHLGGDSIDAMSLAVHSQRSKLPVTVQMIYLYPVLREMASAAAREITRNADLDRQVKPFELITSFGDVDELSKEVAAKCGIDPLCVEDILPCLPSQETYVKSNVTVAGTTTVQQIMVISPELDLDRVCTAWEATVASLTILRTRIVLLDSGTPVQVVSTMVEPAHRSDAHLEEYLTSDAQDNMVYGSALSRAAVAQDRAGQWYFVWTSNHAIYDGWSAGLLMARLWRAYEKEEDATNAQVEDGSFKKLIRYIVEQDAEEAASYWQQQFHGIQDGKLFDILSLGSSQKTQVDTMLEFTAYADGLQSQLIPGVTAATLIHAAWGVVLGHWQQSTDVVLNIPVTGRSAPVPGLNNLAAPTIARIPVRVHLNREENSGSLEQFVAALQDKLNSMIPYEQTGMRLISQSSPEAKAACTAAIHLAVHPNRTSVQSQFKSRLHHHSTTQLALRAAPISPECFISSDDSVDVILHVDSRCVNLKDSEILGHRFQYVLAQLCKPDPEKRLHDLFSDMDSTASATSIIIKKHQFASGRVTFLLDKGALDTQNILNSQSVITSRAQFM
ncbi:hypothetical protein BKA65DRAFT_387194 [Rhexocercosporidium sp. MPI-PUGE-AT-0058]|nr:hypothetical protein BKA65DRAFT_387194 [Rhexocercosporidium sp. MPI-PUGE-AT-0058]